MKRLLFLAPLMALFSQPVHARPEVLELPDFNSGKAVWIVKLGPSFNSAVGDWKEKTKENWEETYKNLNLDSSFPSSIGYDVEIEFNKSFGHKPVYWGMGLGLATRGFKANAEWSKTTVSSTFGDVISHVVKQNNTLTAYNVYVEPIIIGYKYTFLRNMAIDAHLGGFASFDFAGNNKVYNYDFQLSSGVGREKENTTSISLSDLNKYSRLDAGFNLGIGVWYGHINLDFEWQRGFINMFDSSSNYYAQAFKLRLGYAF